MYMAENTGKTRKTTKKCISDKMRDDFSKRISALADEIKRYGITALYQELLRNGVITSEYKINTFRTKYKRMVKGNGGLLSDLELIGPILRILNFPTSFLFMDTVKKDDTSILVNAIRDTIRKEFKEEKLKVKIKLLPVYQEIFIEACFFFYLKMDFGIVTLTNNMHPFIPLTLELHHRMRIMHPKISSGEPFNELIRLLLNGPFSSIIQLIQKTQNQFTIDEVVHFQYVQGQSGMISSLLVLFLSIAYHCRLIHRLFLHFSNNDYIRYGSKFVSLVNMPQMSHIVDKRNFLEAVEDIESSIEKALQTYISLYENDIATLNFRYGQLIMCHDSINQVLSIFLFNTIKTSAFGGRATIFDQPFAISSTKPPMYSIKISNRETDILQSISRLINSAFIDVQTSANAQPNSTNETINAFNFLPNTSMIDDIITEEYQISPPASPVNPPSSSTDSPLSNDDDFVNPLGDS